MRPARNLLSILLLLPFLFLNVGSVFADDEVADDDVPDITARVARIDFARGDAQIRRAGERDWERTVQNLPVVEGDEITTGANARLEIQFNSRNYLRLAENSYLKITTLKDEGIALSLSQGSLSARVLEFDKNEYFFEIDAPKTTVAVQRAGMYRMDAGDQNRAEVRVAVTEDGEARLYSENSGFTLRSGRSSRVSLEGNYAGEWETADASRYADDFDSWSLDRDAAIAKRLKDAAYDKYYDRDIYGAEDLSDNGEWIYTKKYGYVWRPYNSAIGSYANWSPYRYGHWRWIPPYGWTWVNDEPWGWATYHHGRWVYVDRNWAWTPYPQHRSRRNWWHPALVVINYIGSNICWYPLPYDHGYYNYNSTYIDRRRTTIINNTTVVINPTPTPATTVITGIGNPRIRRTQPPIGEVPVTGVVAVSAANFGVTAGGYVTAPPDAATRVLSRTPFETENLPALPNYKDVSGRVGKEILAANPRFERLNPQMQIGAGERKDGVSMDENLRKERIYGNRPPVERISPREVKENVGGDEQRQTRETGAVKRLPRSEIIRNGDSGDNSEIRENRNSKIRPTGGKPPETGDEEKSVYRPREKNQERERTPPVYVPPQNEERREKRQEPPERQQPPQPQPRVEPKPREEKREERREEKPPAKDSAKPVETIDN